jgi:hypothetical protein
MGEQSKWFCKGCGKTLHPYRLTRVGIGVHHYDLDKDSSRDGLLNCGPVVEVLPMSEVEKIERVKEIVTKWALSDTDAAHALEDTEAFMAIIEALEFDPYLSVGASAGE